MNLQFQLRDLNDFHWDFAIKVSDVYMCLVHISNLIRHPREYNHLYPHRMHSDVHWSLVTLNFHIVWIPYELILLHIGTTHRMVFDTFIFLSSSFIDESPTAPQPKLTLSIIVMTMRKFLWELNTILLSPRRVSHLRRC